MSVSLNPTSNVVKTPVSNFPQKSDEKQSKSSISTTTKVLVGSSLIALAAVGIYLATRGKAREKTVEKAVKNAGKAFDEISNKVPDKVSTDGVVSTVTKLELTGDDAINKLNEMYKAGKSIKYAYIPKNRKDVVVVIEDYNGNGGHNLYSRMFDRKTFKYNYKTDMIVDDVKPLSSKCFFRYFSNKKLGEAKIISENGAKISINNSMRPSSRLQKDLTISKDGLIYKKSKYIRERDNAKICTEEVTIHDYAGFKYSVNGAVEDVSENFDIHKKEFFKQLRKK